MKIIDISHGLNNSTPVYPGDHAFSLSRFKTFEIDSYNSFLMETCLHAGTHIDAPMHITADKRMISEFSADNFAGEGILLDVRGEKPIVMRDGYREIDFGGRIVLLYTGFDEYFHTEAYYESYPVLSAELASFLADSEIKILGLDTPSPDYFPFEIHKLLLSRGIFIIENLTGLGNLLGALKFEVIALPLKIDAEASLTRAVCIIRNP